MKKQSSSKTLSKEQATQGGEAKIVHLKTESIRDGEFVGVAQVLAQSKVTVGNWMYPGARDAYPQHPRLRSVDKYYPYAQGGPLLVDYPQTPQEIEECEAKAAVLKRLGHRYLIVTTGMTLQEGAEQLRKSK